MTNNADLKAVLNEVQRATNKFPTWPTDPLHALAVLGEEYGELTQAVLQTVYEPHKSGKENVRREALQVAAMALRFLISLDYYHYTPVPQHNQGAFDGWVTLDGRILQRDELRAVLEHKIECKGE